MNIFQTQLVFADGETMREKAIKGLPEDCRFVRSLPPQIPPHRVSVLEFMGQENTGSAGDSKGVEG